MATLVVAVGVCVAACSSDDPSADTAADTAAPESTTTTAEAADPTTTEVVETTTTAAAEPATTLGEELDAIVAQTQVPALGAAVFDRSGAIDMAVSGLRDRAGTTPVELDDHFHLGSNTKAITATLLARLSEQDRGIGFDTTLGEAFPALTAIHDDYVGVTMAQLMAHSGGVRIASDPPLAELDSAAENEAFLALPGTEARARMAEWSITAPPVVAPDSISRYSNDNYVIVGAAMEAVTGESWEQLIATEVFAPLAMESCGFGPPGTEDDTDQPKGHDPVTGEAAYIDNPPYLGPAARIYCSMADWGRLLTEFLTGIDGESDFLDQTSFDRLLEPRPVPIEGGPPGGVALGWYLLDGPDGVSYWHNGSNTLWYSQAIVLPGLDRVVLAVSNEFETGQQATDLAFAVLSERYE